MYLINCGIISKQFLSFRFAGNKSFQLKVIPWILYEHWNEKVRSYPGGR